MNLNQVTLEAIDIESSVSFCRRLGFTQIVDAPHYAPFACSDGDLRKIALRIARAQKVQCYEFVKPLAESNDGQTLYLSSVSSAVTMRIYEKSKQLGRGTEWVRAELQVRPQKNVKHVVATLSPVEVWGIAK